MARNKEERTLLIAIGIILVAAIFANSSFMGSLITTCENTEPESLSEYDEYILSVNGTYDFSTGLMDIGNQTIVVETALMEIPEVGIYTLQTRGNDTCSELMMDILVNSTDALLSQKTVAIHNGLYYWCNNEDTVLVSSDNVVAFSQYYANFEECSTQEIEANENESIVIETDYATGTTTFKTQQKTTNPCATHTCPTDFECKVSADEAICESTKQDAGNYKTATILGGFAILVAIYFIFEKGPKKGLFVDNATRNKRRKRRK